MMPFYDRESELRRLRRLMERGQGGLAVLYGRRRCGKSRLIKELDSGRMIVFQADQREAALQRQALAALIEPWVPGFGAVVYPDWRTLILALHHRCDSPLTLCLDEFPYLAMSDDSLPSQLQAYLDQYPDGPLIIILCGSAQRMMRGLVLDASAPLYGRAAEVIRINPLKPYWLSQAFPAGSPEDWVREYALWGGIPRYWALRRGYATMDEAVVDMVLDPMGILYEEPIRLFLDEVRSAVQLLSIMTLVGEGCRRLSELATRLEKPGTQLARPLQFLTELRFLEREIPFGESARNSKKGVYGIADPFLAFHFRFVAPHRSGLEQGMGAQLWQRLQPAWEQQVAGVWESMCREALPLLLPELELQPASRWWGRLPDGTAMELDFIAMDTRQEVLVLGEVKWSAKPDARAMAQRLGRFAQLSPLASGKSIKKVLFSRSSVKDPALDHCFTPAEVIDVLR